MRISASNIYKRFDKSWVIKDFNYTFEEFKCYGIQGPNGSGKTTLLKILSGYLSYTKGNLEYFDAGNSISSASFLKNLSLWAPYLELDEELNPEELFKHYSHFVPFQSHSFESFFSNLDLGKKTKRIEDYSSGMKQKLGLAFALNRNSKALILDEPSSYLDEKNKDWLNSCLKEQIGNKTILIASNDANDFNFCDEIIRFQ